MPADHRVEGRPDRLHTARAARDRADRARAGRAAPGPAPARPHRSIHPRHRPVRHRWSVPLRRGTRLVRRWCTRSARQSSGTISSSSRWRYRCSAASSSTWATRRSFQREATSTSSWSATPAWARVSSCRCVGSAGAAFAAQLHSATEPSSLGRAGLCREPAVARRQAVSQLAPRGVYVCGNTATTTGLTVRR